MKFRPACLQMLQSLPLAVLPAAASVFVVEFSQVLSMVLSATWAPRSLSPSTTPLQARIDKASDSSNLKSILGSVNDISQQLGQIEAILKLVVDAANAVNGHLSKTDVTL